MIRVGNRVLFSLSVVVLAWTPLLAPAQAQFTQQGPKLVGTGAIGAAFQGDAVALSGDGNTVIVGGREDNGGAGAAWVSRAPAGCGASKRNWSARAP
jgi:hypothetical protein